MASNTIRKNNDFVRMIYLCVVRLFFRSFVRHISFGCSWDTDSNVLIRSPSDMIQYLQCKCLTILRFEGREKILMNDNATVIILIAVWHTFSIWKISLHQLWIFDTWKSICFHVFMRYPSFSDCRWLWIEAN